MPAKPLSLLWPPDLESAPSAPRLTPAAAVDLGLATTVEALASRHGYAPHIRDTLVALCGDPAVIRYRQDILDDLLANPRLAGQLADLLPRLFALDSFAFSARPDQSPLYEVVWRIGQLETYVDVVRGLNGVFAPPRADLRSEGLLRLRDLTAAIAAEPAFKHLVEALPALVAQVRGISSITIGVNLDDQLRPAAATLLAVNNRQFRGPESSLLYTLFGREPSGAGWEGLAPLHGIPPEARSANQPHGAEMNNPLLYPLLRDLSEVLKRTSQPVANALRRFVQVNILLLTGFSGELAFYLGAARLAADLRAAGLPVCRPEIAPAEERTCIVEGAYNVNLALRQMKGTTGGTDLRESVVTNDVVFDADGRIFVLTGPNRGGKTTYTQAVGLIQVLAQAGLFVPGRRARLSPVDGIFTHFPAEERPASEAGRLGEEAQRLSEIFTAATRHSLILLNESLASTSPGESLYLARDIVRILRRLGARAIFATHLHDLAAGVDTLNAGTPGDSTVISMVSLATESNGSGEAQRTYRIVPGPPRGHSYAHEIAARYGISYEQLEQLLRGRGMVE